MDASFLGAHRTHNGTIVVFLLSKNCKDPFISKNGGFGMVWCCFGKEGSMPNEAVTLDENSSSE